MTFTPSSTLSAEQARFLEQTEVSPSGCWLWTNAKNSAGYGCCWWQNRLQGAHRVAWKLFRSENPDKLSVCHRCDTPACCNPKHLFLGSHTDNMRDCILKGRKKTIPRIISDEQAPALLQTSAEEKLSWAEIGHRFGISRSTARREIIRRRGGSHLHAGQKISDSDVPVLFNLREQGFSQRAIANKFAVSAGLICDILNGKKRTGTT